MSSNGDEVLKLATADGIATMTLNRPQAGNAIDHEMAVRLREAVDHVEASGASAVVITGAGRTFCAGGDVRTMVGAADPSQHVHSLATATHEVLLALRASRVPIVAAVNGAAAGAGLGLVLACDVVVASSSARFVCAYGTVGLSPDCGVSALLPEIVGPRRAAMLLLTDTPLDARGALDAGLVTEVCAPEETLARAREIAGGFARRSRTATAETLALLRSSRSRSYVEQLRYEADAIARCAATPEARGMLAQFANR